MNILLLRVLLLSSLFVSASAQSTPNNLTIQDIFNLETVSDPQISPDGKRIVYVRQFAEIMTDRRCSNLWIINFDGTDHRPLTTGNFNDASPRWSPDGKQIIYISNRDQTSGSPPQIYRRWMDTGETAKLTNLTQAPAGIALSPDGKWISFTMHVPDAPASIIKMPAPPEGARWAEPAKVIDKLVYRFNGAGYLKPGYTHLFVLPSEGGTPRQISSGKFQHGGAAFGASEAVWTPDGKYLLMSANRNQDYEREARDANVYEFSVADGSVRALTSRKGPDNSPQISPDGKLIAYVGFEDKYQGYQVTQLQVMSRDGSNQRVISSKWDRDVANVRWAGDGGGLYFTSDDQGNTGLYFITLDGAVKKLLNNVGSSTSAYGGGGAFSMAKNGAFAITQCNPRNPGDIAAGMLGDGKVKV
ncbi:MAG: TolB family protein, partial [Blastocatellia bacterium]